MGSKMCSYPRFLYHWHALKAFLPSFTNFHHFLSIFIPFLPLLTSFCYFLLSFINSSSIKNVVLFLFSDLLKCTSPTILLDATQQTLITCLRLRTSRTNHSISGFLIIVPILIFEDSDILKQKSKKRTVLIVVQ